MDLFFFTRVAFEVSSNSKKQMKLSMSLLNQSVRNVFFVNEATCLNLTYLLGSPKKKALEKPRLVYRSYESGH